jgi:hypothetical protein
MFRSLATGALALAATNSVSLAQDSLAGKVYAFHSPARGGCPPLDWHIVADTNGTLAGMISWNNMQDMAHATGTYNMQAKTFQMNAREVGGQQRSATITGEIRSDGWLIANLNGPNADCKRVAVPFLAPHPGNG